ncbi:response regulator transcription factor [Clostridium felsineum]|uniref:response regulator transcription factor n=2 Tax=Clostridium felsineum TaxID=36839 RepID=UPI00098BEB9F|nr:response regulator transcription factor [Clostridium felsineum]URZ00078.1 Transcriptional regulatory protein WalR [Clostridium felsineum]
MNNKILIIEDDKEISEMLKSYLVNEGFVICTAFDGEEGILKFLKKEFDLIILDIMLPKLDGMEVLNVIRKKSTVPVLIMSAKDTDVDKALGLGFGADDYIAKPFSMIEILARIKAAIRRATRYSKDTIKEQCTIEIGDLIININDFSVNKRGQKVQLTSKEFEILKLFCKNPKRVFTKAQVYSEVWEDEYYGDDNVINVHIRRLREKIEDDPSKPKYIKTLWGIGYKMSDLK